MPLFDLLPRRNRTWDRRYEDVARVLREQNSGSGGIGDSFDGYTPGPFGLLEMEADQRRSLLARLRQAMLDRMAQNTQTQMQEDLRSRIDAQTGGGGYSTGGTGNSFPSGGGSFGGGAWWDDLARLAGRSSDRRGTVTITDLPPDR